MHTIKLILVHFLLLFIIFSCEKKEKNKWVYTDPEQKIEISSVKGYHIDSATGVNLPTPENGDSTVFIDIDNDNNDDFEITMYHRINRELLEIGAPESIYFHYYIYIKGVTDDQFIAKGSEFASYYSGNCFNVSHPYNEFETIKDSVWADSLNINIYHHDFECECITGHASEGGNYLGVKLNKNSNTYFGWIHFTSEANSLTILDYALCLENNKKIYAGEYE